MSIRYDLLTLTRPNAEAIVRTELAAEFLHAEHVQIGDRLICSAGVNWEATQSRPILAFPEQILPNAERIGGSSISEWVKEITVRLERILVPDPRPWQLHVYPKSVGYSKEGMRRAELIAKEVLSLCKKRNRQLLRANVAPGEQFDVHPCALVQVMCEDVGKGFYSFASPSLTQSLVAALSPHVGGYLLLEEDKNPPSRAYKKLREALTRIGLSIAPGQTCIDLGASPGGWSWDVVQAGAKLIAVDRAPLREDLMKHPAVTFIKGDGFLFEPSTPVDWLLCDIIAAPDRSIGLLQRWVESHWAKYFCVTIKFKGSSEYGKLSTLKDFLRVSSKKFLVRQLVANKNEVTAIGVIRENSGR